MSSYPIVEQRALNPLAGSFWRPPRRSLGELPSLRPGTQLVVYVDGDYQRLPATLRGNERSLVEATNVLVVDVNPRHRATVEIELMSNKPGEPFVVQASFSCTVTDPLDVARSAPRDILPTLESHIKSDTETMKTGDAYGLEDLAQVRELVTSRITAFCMGRPPLVPGMSIELADVEVEIPLHLRNHVKDEQDERYRQVLERMRSTFTVEQAEVLEKVLERSPEAIEAMWLTLDDPRYRAASDRSFGERNRQQEQLFRVFDKLASGGHLDGVAFDTPRLIDGLLNSLVPPSNPTQKDSSFVLNKSDAKRAQLSSTGAHVDEDGPNEPPDEEALGD